MPAQDRPTRTMNIAEVRTLLSSLVDEIVRSKARIRVQKSGITVAALVSIEDLEWLQQRDREREENLKAMERFSLAFADVPVEELEAEIARIIAEIRAEDAAEAERQPA